MEEAPNMESVSEVCQKRIDDAIARSTTREAKAYFIGTDNSRSDGDAPWSDMHTFRSREGAIAKMIEKIKSEQGGCESDSPEDEAEYENRLPNIHVVGVQDYWIPPHGWEAIKNS